MVEKGQKRITMNTVFENIAGECILSVRIEVHLRHNVQFYPFPTF